MFDFGNANDNQRKAIECVDGPLLITAGPGTGKTATLVKRTIYMIQEKGVKPEQIMVATFTEKAAKELITRISNELADKKIPVNINEMYIGTFHSICLRFIKEHLEYTRIKKNYRTLDDFDQKYTVFQNIGRFRSIDGFELAITNRWAWDQAKSICAYVNNLTEELITPEELVLDTRPEVVALGKIQKAYYEILEEKNYLDFSNIQTEAYRLLNDHVEVLDEVRDKIKYLMIDEYQDTNYIQELIVFLIAGSSNNICVVGDDDQGLYRFRGATIRNILEFPKKFDKCAIVPLDVNYRSNSDIVDFYNNWMKTTSGSRFRFAWDDFRYSKTIIPHKQTTLSSPAVIKVESIEYDDAWCEENLKFIRKLQDAGKITDLNQVAFLFKSVKSAAVVKLANYLEKNGINVYSPRSDMFFERNEVKMLLGALLLCFPRFVKQLEDESFTFVDRDLCLYYRNCIAHVTQYLKMPEGKSLITFIRSVGKRHVSMTKNTDYAFSGLVYQMFQCEPFASMLGADMSSGLMDLRPTRNISMLTNILCKFEYLHRLDVFTPVKIDHDVELFFNMYLKYMRRGGIPEYEDDSEYAPSGCVSFLTIHQSKGMEFPIVIVGSLSGTPRAKNDALLETLEKSYYKRSSFEPLTAIKFFDFWRLYYTAFSRAQNLLVLTANVTNREPSLYFRDVYAPLVNYDDPKFDAGEFDFSEVKDVNLKETYSFTSHIAVYEECALQYKFFKELGFTPIRVGATIFGTLIHQTIEDMHRAALRHEEETITPENIRLWLDTNYATISQSEHAYLGQPQVDAAYRQVLRYAERQADKWYTIQEAEVEVSLVKSDYIIEGTIDLIKGEGDTVEIVDFKSERKPDLVKDYERIQRYKKQLEVYAHLVEARTGHTVSRMLLYYTGEESGIPTIPFSYNKNNIDATIREFDEIVHKIKRKDFSCKSKNQVTCDNCDFRYYCANK